MVGTLAMLVAITHGSVATAASPEATAKARWTAGIEAYAEGDYAVAVEAFEDIVDLGYATAEVYYNLGDAYFKLGQTSASRPFAEGELGRSILNFSRALKLNPAMQDAEYNLDLARDYTNDTEPLPESFIKRMWHSLRDNMTSNGWAILSVIMLALTLMLVLVYLLASRIALRKTAFFVAIATALILFLSTALALSQRSAQLSDERAVVICNDTAPVHASPNSASKVVRQPSQGVIVDIVRSSDEWSEIAFADGEKGWIRNDSIERI